MRPGGTTVAAVPQSATVEDKSRKTLHSLQPTATDKENLVAGGRVLRSSAPSKTSLKDEMSAKTANKQDSGKKQKKIITPTHKDKACQTARGDKIKIEVEDLTSEAGPSENYWQIIAERRRIALDDALEENKELSQRVERLEEQNKSYKDMLDETTTLVQVLQEMIGEDHPDINNSLDDSVL